VILTEEEQRMLDGGEGPAVAAAMDLLVRYGDVLGAEKLIDTDNVCGANIFSARQRELGGSTPDQVFAEISLDSPGSFEIPQVRAHSCQLIGPMDTERWQVQGVPEPVHDAVMDSESYSGRHGINLLNTCTPYQVGNVPVRGEHCAWMESSAVIYINSVLGAMTNVEGRESAAAAMLTGKIPYWGYHLPENRHATIHVEVDVDVTTNRDWGLLGYAVGKAAGETVPVITGIKDTPNLGKLKHFGAAAATSGGVEMYHIPGVTAEAQTLEQALGGKQSPRSVRYGKQERAAAYARLNVTAADADVDLVMIGCPHASLDQIRDVCDLLGDRTVAPGTQLWLFTPRAIRLLAERNGYGDRLRAAGGQLMSDTCPAIGRFVPDGARVIVTDSAKQAHYLPAIMNVQGWFGDTRECVDAAVTGRWQGELS
jgi:hypothetical protein